MISIVMAYYNRPDQLYATLKSIERYKSSKDVEIIIVDDASKIRPKQLGDFDLNIKMFRISIEEKKWINPCIPYNIGFKRASGDYIIIQNPECIHVGDVISYVNENADRDTYLSFHCYSIDIETTHKVWKTLDEIKNIKFSDGQPNDDDNGWYNHKIYRPAAYHFCNAISKYRLDEIGGFNEIFKDGVGKDDVAFAHAIEHNKEMNVKFIDDPFVIHQYHPRQWKGAGHINIKLFKQVQLETVRRELMEEYFKEYNVTNLDDLGSKTKSEFEGELIRRRGFIK